LGTLLALLVPHLVTRIQNTAFCQKNEIQTERTFNKFQYTYFGEPLTHWAPSTMGFYLCHWVPELFETVIIPAIHIKYDGINAL
jgi:hypothetical protein